MSAPLHGWFPDPFGRHQLRYFDGVAWTEHVATDGHRSIDPAVAGATPEATRPDVPAQWPTTAAPPEPAPPPPGKASSRIRRQVREVRADRGHDVGGTLHTARVLVINQKARIIGQTREYAVHDRDGRRLGTISEVPRSPGPKISERRRAFDFVVADDGGRPLISLQRPEAGYWTRAPLVVHGPDGTPIGQIVRESRLRNALAVAVSGEDAPPGVQGLSHRLTNAAKRLDPTASARFVLQAGGRQVGQIQAAGRRSWNYTLTDADGHRLAAITKTWAGWAKERFTKADNYVVDMTTVLEDPLRSLVIAAAIVIDFELKRQGG